jgi:hypothetical protein
LCSIFKESLINSFLIKIFFLFFLSISIFAGEVSYSTTSSSDSVEEDLSDGSVHITSSDLELPYDGSTEQMIGLRFSYVNIPQGTTILNAYLIFEVDEDRNDDAYLKIYGEDSDSSETFSDSANVSSRPLTSSVSWSITDNGLAVGDLYTTPSITTIVQDIVNRAGWASDTMSIIIKNNGTSRGRRQTAVSGNVKLVVEYDGSPAPCLDYDTDDENCNEITFLHNVTTATSGCIQGSTSDSDSNKEDYYHFTAGMDGYLDVTTLSPNGHDYYMSVGSSCGGEQYYSVVADQSHNIPQIILTTGQSVYFYFKETGGDTDQYQVNFNFQAATFQANDDYVSTNPGSNITIEMLDNDFPGSGNTLNTGSVTIVQDVTTGTLVLNSDGSTTYTPALGSYTDTFTYTVENDVPETSNIATVTINVGLVAGDRDFTIRNPEDTRNIRGNYIIGGNMNLCEDDGHGQCKGDNSNSNSNPDIYIDIDTNTTTYNSTSFDLNVPPNSKVVWAGLYWQGVIHRSINNGDFMGGTVPSDAPLLGGSTNQIDLTNNTYGAEHVSLKIGSDSYIDITADQLDYSKLGYGAFADVTEHINLTNPNETYYLADVKSHIGAEPNHGNYAGWSLIIIYENSDEDYRNITLFDGFATVDSSYNADLLIEGFLTPAQAPIESKIAFFTMDGEGGTTSLTVSTDTLSNKVYGPDNPADRLFNSTIMGVNNRQPNYPSLRLDLDIIDLVDYLGPLETSATLQPRSAGDRYTASYFIMSSELYMPDFCYDYAYKQNGIFFTEDNDGTQMPRLTGDVINNDNINMTIYLKSLVSDIPVIGMQIDIVDMNTSYTTYQRNSTYLAKIGDLIPNHIPDTSLDVSTIGDNPEYINNIYIGDVDQNNDFYIYYTLNSNKSTLDTPIDVNIRYQLFLDGQYFDYTSKLGVDMSMCSTSNFKYTPLTGIFNIVHNDYYSWDGTSGSRYYNLPTQVTSREGNFKVIALEESDHDELRGSSTIVGVEMIDISAFHDTRASCQELNSSISDRIWVSFENNNSSITFDDTAINTAISLNNKISLSSEFYQYARENTAFRISYIITNDGNESLVQLSAPDASGNKQIVNYNELTVGLTSCNSEVNYPDSSSGTVQATTSISDACGASGSLLSPKHIQSCMECLFGINTKVVCSRDNFALRPEAFLIKINDQDQNNITIQNRLVDNVSGVTTPNSEILDIAAGYQYNIEANATNHLNNMASLGYIKSYNSANLQDTSLYLWEPRGGKIVSGCNDINDKNADIRFQDGSLDTNTSVDQVGHYRLMVRDLSWTTVDSNYLKMTHHVGPYFKVPTATTNLDCILDSSVTEVVGAVAGSPSPLIGCNISSSHDSSNAISNLKYRDYNVTLHPYKFDLNTTVASTGLNFSTLTPQSFIYMADMSKDENMSFHINGSIVARGEDNSTLSNFVDSCFAVPLDLVIQKSDTDLTDANGNNVAFQVLLNDLNSSGDINFTIESNNTVTIADILLQIPDSSFFKDLEGSMNSRINLNYFRRNNAAANPKVITYGDYNVSCTNDTTDCQFNADLITTKTTRGGLGINNNITHYYARNHSPRYRFKDNNGTAYIYYEVFCNGAGCDKTLLQNGTASQTTDDPRWFINTQHNNGFGSANSITQKNNTLVTGTDATGNHQDSSFISYDESRGYPYKTTMETNSSNWLIYNKYDANATKNSFEVEFIKNDTNWAGMHETNSSTNTKASSKTNRRSIW